MSISNVTYSIHAAFAKDRSMIVKGVPAWRFHRANAPYAMMLMNEDDPCLLLPVNRDYTPLGFGKEIAHYNAHSLRAIRFHSDPRAAEGIWHPQPYYLFNYSPAERGDYVKRLHKLAALAVDSTLAKIKLGLLNNGGSK